MKVCGLSSRTEKVYCQILDAMFRYGQSTIYKVKFTFIPKRMSDDHQWAWRILHQTFDRRLT